MSATRATAFVSLLVSLAAMVILSVHQSPTVVFYIDSSNPRSVTVTVTLIKRSARVHRVYVRYSLALLALTRVCFLILAGVLVFYPPAEPRGRTTYVRTYVLLLFFRRDYLTGYTRPIVLLAWSTNI